MKIDQLDILMLLTIPGFGIYSVKCFAIPYTEGRRVLGSTNVPSYCTNHLPDVTVLIGTSTYEWEFDNPDLINVFNPCNICSMRHY